MLPTLESAFESGTLSHPLRGEANGVELFRALALLSGAGLDDSTPGVEALRSRVGHHDHYFFVLVDGLGMNLRGFFPAGGFLESSLAGEIRSPFPSTTAVALTSLATGLWPAEHGLTGWWTHFPEHKRTIAPLIFLERATRTHGSRLGLSIEDLISARPVVGSFFRNTASFLPREITGGAYALWSRSGTPILPFRSNRHLRRLVQRDRRTLSGPSYRYLYILTVDALCHRYGTRSEQVAKEVARVDTLLSRIRSNLPASVRMVVTADHGLVDVPSERTFLLQDADPLTSHLLGGQSGEGRTPVFHVKPGHREAFLEQFERSAAAEHFSLHSPDDLAGMGLYGPHPLSEAAKLHLGDYVGISRDAVRFEYVPVGTDPIRHRAVHGGLLPEEMNVPLCIA